MASEKRKYECPVCFAYILPPVYQCQNGHLVCNDCITKMTNCALCRGDLNDSKCRNLAIESVIEELTLPCPFKEEGCLEVMKGKNMLEHKTNCLFAPKSYCSKLGIKCDTAISIPRLSGHLITHCETLDWRMEPAQAKIKLYGIGGIKIVVEELKTWEPKLVRFPNHSLLIQGLLSDGGEQWQFYFTIIPSMVTFTTPAALQLSLNTEDREAASLTWVGPVRSLKQNDGSRSCFAVPVKHFEASDIWYLTVTCLREPVARPKLELRAFLERDLPDPCSDILTRLRQGAPSQVQRKKKTQSTCKIV